MLQIVIHTPYHNVNICHHIVRRCFCLFSSNGMKATMEQLLYEMFKSDMQKVQILPPAEFQVKISAKGQNRLP